MATEIERKFLVTGDAWRAGAAGTRYRQGYLSSQPERTVRVRAAGRKGVITVKGLTRGASRDEFEYPIPVKDANELLDRLCERPLIEKTRFVVRHRGMTWEIDVFEGENRGLVVAEVELKREDQKVALPPWVGEEVTRDAQYFNSNLARNPFTRWGLKG